MTRPCHESEGEPWKRLPLRRRCLMAQTKTEGTLDEAVKRIVKLNILVRRMAEALDIMSTYHNEHFGACQSNPTWMSGAEAQGECDCGFGLAVAVLAEAREISNTKGGK